MRERNLSLQRANEQMEWTVEVSLIVVFLGENEIEVGKKIYV